MLIAVLSAFLVGAVAYDFLSHRLPNFYILIGLLVALFMQAWSSGWVGVMAGLVGFLSAFVFFIPFYILGGMAAGDVKLMAVVGFFLSAPEALWAGACTLMVGGFLGVSYLVFKGQFRGFVQRYMAMTVLRQHIAAGDDDAARHRFPYAIAIAVGTLLSLYWTPI